MVKLPICFSKRLFWAIKWHAVCRDNMNSKSFCTSSSMTHHTCGVSGHHGFGPWSQLLLQEQGLPPLLSPITNRTPGVFVVWMVVWAWHTVKLGCGKICGRGNAILHSSTEWHSGCQGLSAPEPVGCLVTEGQHSGQGVGVMGVKIFVRLNGSFFFSLIITD